MVNTNNQMPLKFDVALPYWIFLLAMILSSFFVGLPTNKGWFILYQLDGLAIENLISLTKLKAFTAFKLLQILVSTLLLCLHLSLLALPFLIRKWYFPKLLFWIPLLLMIAQLSIFPLFFVLLLPFLFLWLICLYRLLLDTKMGYWRKGKVNHN